MPLGTVRRICDESKETGPGTDFVPVEIAPEVQGGGIALVTPGGHRVEGLDLETAAALLARLA
jgi:hypothetical protein